MTEADEIRIEQYIQGELSPQERDSFKQRLSNEQPLKKAYENSLAARALIKEAGRMELRETLESFEKKSGRGKVRVLRKKRTYLIAASLLFLLGFYFMSDYMGNKTPAQVYDSYFETYPAPSVMRGNPNQETPYWDAGVESYANGNYGEALSHFERAESFIIKDKVEFYKSLCHLQLDDKYLNTTTHALRKVSNGDSNYREQALWYYGLALLKNGQESDAKKVFQKIKDAKSYNYEEASEILKIKLKD